MTYHLQPEAKQTGSTMIEVLISLLVLGVGLYGVFAFQLQAVKESLDSSQRSRAIWVAQELINRIQVNQAGRESGFYNNGDAGFDSDNDINCNNKPNPYCADRNGDPADSCTSEEMADFDLWETVCWHNDVRDPQPRPQFINMQVTLSCNDAIEEAPDIPCSEDSNYILNVSWQSKSVSDDQKDASYNTATLQTQAFTQVFRP